MEGYFKEYRYFQNRCPKLLCPSNLVQIVYFHDTRTLPSQRLYFFLLSTHLAPTHLSPQLQLKRDVMRIRDLIEGNIPAIITSQARGSEKNTA